MRICQGVFDPKPSRTPCGSSCSPKWGFRCSPCSFPGDHCSGWNRPLVRGSSPYCSRVFAFSPNQVNFPRPGTSASGCRRRERAGVRLVQLDHVRLAATADSWHISAQKPFTHDSSTKGPPAHQLVFFRSVWVAVLDSFMYCSYQGLIHRFGCLAGEVPHYSSTVYRCVPVISIVISSTFLMPTSSKQPWNCPLHSAGSRLGHSRSRLK